MRRLRWPAAVLVPPVLLVGAWLVFTRHVPYPIPAQHRAPAAWSQGEGLTLRYLGVSGYELSDGVTTVLLDPTPTRPDPVQLVTGPVVSDPELAQRWCPKADLILVNHTHYDHALDVGEIAVRTGAQVWGSSNTVNLALSRGVRPEKTRVVEHGAQLQFGAFTIEVRRSRHTDIVVANPMSGRIAPDAGAMWFWNYALDETLAFRLSARGSTLWFHPTTTYAPGELGGLSAKTLLVGLTGEKLTRLKVDGLLSEARPARVLPTHFDNFFQPIGKGLALFPGTPLDAIKALFLEADPRLEWGVLDYGQTIVLPPD